MDLGCLEWDIPWNFCLEYLTMNCLGVDDVNYKSLIHTNSLDSREKKQNTSSKF